jgi:hypothetical protein
VCGGGGCVLVFAVCGAGVCVCVLCVRERERKPGARKENRSAKVRVRKSQECRRVNAKARNLRLKKSVKVTA